MRLRPVVILLLMLAAVVPSIADSRAYFAISTSKTFLPGEKVGIRVYATGVNSLEFRVYKVKDPIAFFERLDSVHDFGHVVPAETVESPTLLERFHDWKHDQWIDIRDFFRKQFSPKSRASIREVEGRARMNKAASAAIFAQAPLLNRSQLVARWRQDMATPLLISETQVIPVSSLPKGVYLVEATDGTLRAYTIAIVSQLGVITKSAPGQILAFTADRRTGAPVPDADVRVWSDKKEDAALKSDANGLTQSSMRETRYEDVRVLAVHGDDAALVSPDSYSLSSDPSQDWTGYVYTERPVYRPLDTVHFKAILRTRSGEDYKVPSGTAVQVVIDDSAGKPLLQSNFTVSEFGTINGDLALPRSAALGYYSIAVNSNSGSSYQIAGGFYVEDYKKPEYQVKVTPAAPRVLQGNSISATIEAKYYFGEPVAGANVTYVVHTSRYYSPFIESDDADADADSADNPAAQSDDDEYDAGDQISQQTGRLDADGKLTVTIPTSVDDHHYDMRYRIEARVTDEANREIDGHNSVIATYGSFEVGISTDSYVFQAGDTIRATAVAKDYGGNPIQASIHVEFVKLRSSYPQQDESVISAQDLRTGADGTATLTLSASEAGDCVVRVTAMTPENRQVTGQDWVWVTSPAESWFGGANRSIRMIPDKKSYKIGDTAHILVLTGSTEAYLLVTAEGRTIQSSKIVHATAPSVTIDIPLGSEQQPNVYVSVAFLRDNQLFQSNRNILVPAVQQKLQIEVQPSQPQFEPGQKASYTLSVHDSEGKPVQSELSLGIVDEAIYAIHPDESGDISDTFYGAAYDRVSTNSSLDFYFSGEAGKREMFLAYQGVKSPRPLAQIKPGDALVQPRVRKVFPDTALWLPDIHTDAQGHATAELDFPDSLTSWRATVRGVTLDTKVGSGISNVIVRKNVMVRLAVPRFFRQGDEVTVSVIVHNYLPSAKSVQLSLDAQGLEILSGATADVQVPSNGEAKLDWRVRAKTASQAVLDAKALTNEESDAMELTLPVLPVGVKQTIAQSGSIAADVQYATATVNLPANPDQTGPSLDITVNSSIAGSIFSALDYLTSYPYGCTEQTMSSFLPDIVVAKAMKDLQLQSTLDTPDLEDKIHSGIARLKDFQHDDGGWGWWKDDDSQVFMTAYVASGLGEAHAAGYDFDAQSLNRAKQWLHSSLIEHPQMRPDLRAYVVYALAQNGDAKPEELNSAWEQRSAMTTQGLAMVGLAFQDGGDLVKAREIAAQIESQATVTETQAYWPASYDYFMEFYIDDAAETTAYAVRLLSLVKPDSPLLPKAAFWLVNDRDGGYFWDSTKQTAMVIFGLTEYMKTTHELNSAFHADILVNGKEVMSHDFTPKDAFSVTQPTIHLDSAELRPGANEIRIQKTGASRLYWSATGAYFSDDRKLVQNNKLSLNITRDYFLLSPLQANVVSRLLYKCTWPSCDYRSMFQRDIEVHVRVMHLG